MKQFEVELALQHVATEMSKWNEAHHNFLREVGKIMDRLIHEAVANRMSVEQIAGLTGFTKHRIRRQMKQMGLDYRYSKTALADSAAKALKSNAELLGVDPLDIDLSSPLAYLPMGSELRTQLQSDAVKGVKELDDDLTPAGKRLREYAANGGKDGKPWKFVPCARQHHPNLLCILPDGHDE
jgi:hypothetical protein